ncbi:ABC transporter permease [Aminithiophilus ramosus]|uniref:ABC transporter permease n=2 Tax=Synergistales TaxID=649776 RepID=A0A9Q7A8Y5_9BACT|nr:ABC transporter permease [Aminithiophilus ramosus]QTX32656.1 ABC transporter permease [Aminithiophilus ramosus]QVL36531.1 ABC transporter permease [Synergistota bacterium]
MNSECQRLSPDLFEPASAPPDEREAISRPSLTFWQDAWRKLRKNRVATASMAVIVACILLAAVGPLLVPYSYSATDASAIDAPPDGSHWFGTDPLGRDLWARTWMGARVSLLIGFAAALINTCIGVVIGGIAGYVGGKVDMIVMRIIDVLYAIPYMIVAILLMVVLKPGMTSIVVAMVLIGWIKSARLVRGQVLSLKSQEYVLAARKLGASDFRIIFRHMIPNTLGLIITDLTMAVPYAIFAEAFLSYIGLGIQPPQSSWGLLARYGAQNFRVAPFQLFIPAVVISVTMLSLNLFGDGLRDALDPKLR